MARGNPHSRSEARLWLEELVRSMDFAVWRNGDITFDQGAQTMTPDALQQICLDEHRDSYVIFYLDDQDTPSSPNEYLNNLEARLESVHAFGLESELNWPVETNEDSL
ncbi:hypothetical protein AVEN_232146-1 [Araneus ventricosus]|uniref:Uncharacterized protein n=1 Tax=Araneus ventricosus TaxID=182803 RepID=A0A4Y2G6L0_ARAVE|nr:hypothetical protein AVEN_232146-1 [Araneus ventricosus]